MERKRKLEVFEPQGAAVGLPAQPSINPYTGRPYSNRYYDILAKRKGGWRREPRCLKHAVCCLEIAASSSQSSACIKI